MKEKILPHQKIRITRGKLTRMGACWSGLHSVAKLLPATVSTNPDHNIRLAKRIIDNDLHHYSIWPWEMTTGVPGGDDMVAERGDSVCLAYGRGEESQWDLQMDALPQLLADMADSLLRHKVFRPARK